MNMYWRPEYTEIENKFYEIRDIIDDSIWMGVGVFFITIVSCLIVGRLIMWLSNMIIQSTKFK